MKTVIPVCISTCAAWALAATALGQNISPAALAQAKAELHQAVEAGQIAGGAHLVFHRGQTACFEIAGVSDIEDKTPFRADTILRIYSMTKPIVSVAAMGLYERGKFQLDDLVAKYIPAFQQATVLAPDGGSPKLVPPKRAMTIRDVFRHTTGYSYGDGNPKVREYYEREGLLYRPPHGMLPPDMTIEKAAEALARIPALQHPGERFTYGFSTDLLGRLIEVWSGQPLDEYLRQAVFVPLQMADTGFSVPPGKRHRFATCHTWQDGKLAIADKAAGSPFNDGFAFLSGGGGLVSTMQDYANFCQMLVEGGQFKGRRLLKEETVKLMFTDQLNGVAGGFRFGLGFAIGEVNLGSGDGQRKAAQYSWGGYASTDFRLVPAEGLFQIFMQQQVPTASELANKLFPIVYAGVRATGKDPAGGKAQAEGPDGASGDAWKKLPDMAVPRWEAGTVVLDDKLYVFGGYESPTRACRRVDVFDPKDRRWRELADLPSAITHMNAVLDGRTVWIAGGFKDGYKGYAIAEVWNYNLDRETVTAAPPLPEPRAGGGLALVGRRLHYLGGLKKDRDTDAADHWVLDLDELAQGEAKWKSAPPMPDPRNQFGTATLGGKIYLLGGMYHHDSGQLDQTRVDVYDSKNDTWSRAADLPAGHSHAEGSTLVQGDRIFILGGMARMGEKRWIDNQILVLVSDNKWKWQGNLPAALSSPVAAIIGDQLYVGGGSPNGATPQPAMWMRRAP